jgi:hypothetical protein
MDVLVRSLRCSRLIPVQAALFNRIPITTIPHANRLVQFNPHQIPHIFSGADLPKASAPPQVEEKHYENLPGK